MFVDTYSIASVDLRFVLVQSKWSQAGNLKGGICRNLKYSVCGIKKIYSVVIRLVGCFSSKPIRARAL